MIRGEVIILLIFNIKLYSLSLIARQVLSKRVQHISVVHSIRYNENLLNVVRMSVKEPPERLAEEARRNVPWKRVRFSFWTLPELCEHYRTTILIRGGVESAGHAPSECHLGRMCVLFGEPWTKQVNQVPCMEMVSMSAASFSRPWITFLREFLLDIVRTSSCEYTFVSRSLIVALRGPSHYHSIAAQLTNVAAPKVNLFVQFRSNGIPSNSILPRCVIPAESNLAHVHD
mmetsp:Transcript_366/g.424  ORF Transcript_366/g.424 Transcript_366/m.424 type:complete len:230 (+) Transcript_366:327-1016(+)